MSAPLYSRGRRPLGAYVTGYPAVLLARLAGESLERSIRAHHAAGRLEVARDLAVTLADLREAAAQAQAATEAGSAEAVPAPPPGGSVMEADSGGTAPAEIDTSAAAEALGVSPRRVCQLLASGDLSGRQDRTGRWHVHVDDLHRLTAERSIPA